MTEKLEIAKIIRSKPETTLCFQCVSELILPDIPPPPILYMNPKEQRLCFTGVIHSKGFLTFETFINSVA